MKFDPFRIFLPLQVVLAVCVLPGLMLAPPVHGRMLLVPLWPGSSNRLAADVVAGGGRLLAPGPIRGSLIVDGGRASFVARLFSRGVLPVSVALTDCGKVQGAVK